MKRILAFLLILVFVLISSACAQKVDETVTAGETMAETTADDAWDVKDRLADLPDADWNGRAFRIATDDASLLLPQNGTNYVGKKIYERNSAVEEKYNVKLTLTEESGLPSITERLRTEALAGTDYCDLAVISANACQQLVLSDALLNVASIPFVTSSGRGIYKSASDAMTLGNTVYGICGDLTFSADSMFAVFFNKKIASATGLPDLYQLVRDNQWDQANFQLYAEEAYSLGRIDGQKIYGFTSTERAEVLLQTFWAASDQQYVNNVYGEKPALAYDSSEIRDGFINQSRKLLYKTVAYLNNTSASTDAFRDDQILFYIAPLSQITDLEGCRADWGIIPIPVYDINQNTRRTYLKSNYQVACFPKGTDTIDFSGQVTQALFAASEGMSRDLSLSKYLNLYLRSAEDGEMLKRILSEPYFDPTEFFGIIYPEYLSSTQTLIQRVVASEGNYKQLYRQYSGMFEKFIDEKVS